MTALAPKYLILWASQTGNAEWIAKNIHSEATNKGYKGDCFVMDEYEIINIQSYGVIIVVCSNTGDGDAPDNSLKFWRFLRRNKDKTYLENTRITVLGLGDSNYTSFNNTGIKIEKKFKDLGAKVFYPKGLADDAEGLENVVDPWIEKLWEVLPTVLKHDNGKSIEDSIKEEQELEKKLTEVEIDPATLPYSMKDREKSLPEPVLKYTHLENSLVNPEEPAKKVEQVKGHPLEISLVGLEAGAKLTGLPRISVPVAKLVKLDEQKKDTSIVPDFVVTPAPISYAPVTMVSCLTTSDSLKRTLEIELDIGEGAHYEPGDSFGIVAPNDESLVLAVLNKLNVTPDQYNDLYKVDGDNLPTHLQKASSVSLLDLFRYGVDLTTQPRKALFRMMADYTSDPKEKLSLMYICSKQGGAVFNELREENPNFLDILETFPSCRPPVERLLDLLPAHMPRFYSISSSPLKRQGKVRFAFNVIEYTTPKNAKRRGVATPWLDRLTKLVPARTTPTNIEIILHGNDIKIPIFIRHNTNAFVLPSNTARPLILIGPGTGIAPFIGFLEHRQTQREIRLALGGVGHQPRRQIKEAFGPIFVYYGFRNKSKDFLFEQEIRAFEKDGTITQLSLAESRASDGTPKTYVQDLLRRDMEKLYDLIINKDAAIYVCGDAKGMAKGVQDVLIEMLTKYQKLDTLEATKLLMHWTSQKKYLRDLWA
ncbi:hypothetical protein BDB01DRAFT_846667 [Pilobolus umbonatus]|nr:hypothetical protein BDB01DRAFT_846667 [Pilobolus umbonatus]